MFKIIGKDAFCFVHNWMHSNIVDPANCTIPYLPDIVNDMPVCEPLAIIRNYYDVIQLVHSGSMTTHDVCKFFYQL